MKILFSILFLFVASVSLYATEVSAENPLAPLFTLLGGATGAKILAWIGTFRVVGKPIAGKLTEFMESILAAVRNSDGKEDDAFVDRIMRSAAYGVVAWLVDYIFSVKLPKAGAVSAQTASSAPATMAVLIAFMIPVLAMTGCKSPEQTAYRSIGTIAHTVDGAMNAWGTYVRAGYATDNQQTEVRRAYESYQAAMRMARATLYVSQGEATYQEQVNAASSAAASLVALLESFGVAVEKGN